MIDPTPDPVHVAPPVATHDHDAPPNEAGRVSVIVAPVTLDGPLLVATIVYVTVEPGVACVALSVLVIARSAWRPIASLSVALLLVAVGSVTPVGAVIVAVLASDPVAPAAMVAVSV